jgi:hypothetical protein
MVPAHSLSRSGEHGNGYVHAHVYAYTGVQQQRGLRHPQHRLLTCSAISLLVSSVALALRLTIKHACGNGAMTEHLLGAIADADVLHGLQRTLRDAVDAVTSSSFQAGVSTFWRCSRVTLLKARASELHTIISCVDRAKHSVRAWYYIYNYISSSCGWSLGALPFCAANACRCCLPQLLLMHTYLVCGKVQKGTVPRKGPRSPSGSMLPCWHCLHCMSRCSQAHAGMQVWVWMTTAYLSACIC